MATVPTHLSRGRFSAAFLLAVVLQAVWANPAWADGPDTYAWTNFVGQPGGPGNADGTGSAARFANPAGVAADSEGNVYVADCNNHTIRKVTPAGLVTTLAGLAGVSGSTDGAGSTARFFRPAGVGADSESNVYVADCNNHTIRKVTPTGVVTTLAGLAGVPGSTDGAGSTARFFRPAGVAADSEGNIFVADYGNHTIRKMTPTGVVTTLAGLAGSRGSDDGTGSAARFNYPAGVAADSAGNVFVADYSNHTIRKVTASGVVTTLAGLARYSGSTDGAGSAARFYNPAAVAVDSEGDVYVADCNNHTIRKVTPAGLVTTLAGSAGVGGSTDGTGSAALFWSPSGVTIGSESNIFVAGTGNHAIRKVTPAGVVTTLAGLPAAIGSTDGTGSAARFDSPFGVAADSAGNVYVADYWNHTIRRATPAGVVTTLAGLAGASGNADGTGSAARFNYPSGVAADSAGNVVVADSSNHTIRKVTPAGVVTTLAGLAGSSGSADGMGGAARFNGPTGVAVDSTGNMFVADSNNNTIRKITVAGTVTTLAGLAGVSGSADGTGGAARFYSPNSVSVDGAGNVFVADFYNHTIRKVTTAGVVTTLAGLAGSSGSTDGTGSAARFCCPSGVAADSAGNVFVADFYNFTIRKITAAGVVTTIGGAPGVAGGVDGVGSHANFSYPTDVAVDTAGNLYVADSDNNRISKGIPHLTGDINCDSYVNVGDLQLFVARWGSGPGYTGPEDISGDGYVNVGDLQLLVSNWGRHL